MAPALTLAIPYYNAPRMLERQLEEFERYPSGVRLHIVDDGSEHAPDLSGCPIPHRHWRIDGDEPWRHHVARNIAMRDARGLCLVTDMDHVLPALYAAAIVRRLSLFKRGQAYRARRIWPNGTDVGKRHPNSYFIDAHDYWAAGGYDEQVAGYYGTDAAFARQLRRAGITIRDLDSIALMWHEGVVDDACASLPRKGSTYHARQHPAIRARVSRAPKPEPSDVFRYPYRMIEDTTDEDDDPN